MTPEQARELLVLNNIDPVTFRRRCAHCKAYLPQKGEDGYSPRRRYCRSGSDCAQEREIAHYLRRHEHRDVGQVRVPTDRLPVDYEVELGAIMDAITSGVKPGLTCACGCGGGIPVFSADGSRNRSMRFADPSHKRAYGLRQDALSVHPMAAGDDKKSERPWRRGHRRKRRGTDNVFVDLASSGGVQRLSLTASQANVIRLLKQMGTTEALNAITFYLNAIENGDM